MFTHWRKYTLNNHRTSCLIMVRALLTDRFSFAMIWVNDIFSTVLILIFSSQVLCYFTSRRAYTHTRTPQKHTVLRQRIYFIIFASLPQDFLASPSSLRVRRVRRLVLHAEAVKGARASRARGTRRKGDVSVVRSLFRRKILAEKAFRIHSRLA